ncbi:MAG: CCA tRNA nucleotidyltransferase [Chloroflexi bacterium]|nr:CCA tRNA nucleotidyltransferase [Chloroflexota bacterium]
METPLETLAGPSDLIPRLIRFFSAGQTPAYLVGGYLRDRLMSRTGARAGDGDVDLAVAGDSESIARQLAAALDASFVPVNPTRGVFRVISAEPAATGEPAWSIDLKGFSGDIQEDLARRDFTVDAMALSLDGQSIDDWAGDNWAGLVIDPFNGRQDLAEKRIRAVSPNVFQEDPGRLLRSVRLVAQLGFRLDPETATLIRKDAYLLEQAPGERLRDEFLTILSLDGARGHLEVLDRLDLLCRLIPELALTKGVEQPRVHYWDVWGHTMHCVEEAELVTKGHRNSPVYMFVPWTPESDLHFSQIAGDGHTRGTLLKLAALFHDIAKPQTKSVEADGRTRFFGHSELGASVVEYRLNQLRMSSRSVALIAKMVEHHLRPNNMSEGVELPTPRAVHRYFRDLGDAAVDTVYLALADYLATNGPVMSLEHWSSHARMMGHILESGAKQPVPTGQDRLINGHDLIEHLGVEPGPLVGELLEKIIEAQSTGEIHTREEALALAQENLPTRRRRE